MSDTPDLTPGNTAPEEIFLQDAGDYESASQFEVTWCVDPQDDADTKYIRADLHEAERARADKAEAERDAAIAAGVEAARLRGEAEGKLLAAETPGVLEGWRRRAEEAEVKLSNALRMLDEQDREYNRKTNTLIERHAEQISKQAAERDALAGKLAKAAECIQDWQSAGCPYCQGDCSSANPPMSYCIMQETRATLAEITEVGNE